MASRQAIMLYKELLRESKKFSSYNYREYFRRRTRDAYRENKNLTDEAKIREQYQYGREMLDVIRRQVTIGHLYTSPKLVIEQPGR